MLISKKNKEPISKYFGIFKDDKKEWTKIMKIIEKDREKFKLRDEKILKSIMKKLILTKPSENGLRRKTNF